LPCAELAAQTEFTITYHFATVNTITTCLLGFTHSLRAQTTPA